MRKCYKMELSSTLAINCVIHRQYVVSRKLSEPLLTSLQNVIRAVNKIKEATHQMTDYLVSFTLQIIKIPTTCLVTKNCAGYQNVLV